MLKVLKWIFGIFSFLILAAVIGVIIFINQFDLNEYKPAIEKFVYEQTGRQLSLNGDIGLKLSLVPTIAVKDVIFSNADWMADKPMVKIKEADVTLYLAPLLHKKLEIEEINIIGAEINVATNSEGQGNWIFSKPTNKEAGEQNKSESELENKLDKEVNDAATPFLAGFVANSFDITDSIVVYEDMKAKSATKVKISMLQFTAQDINSKIDLNYDINVNGENIKGTATIDSLTTLLKNEPYNAVINAKAYGCNLKMKGLLTDLADDLKFDADVNIDSPDGNFGLPKLEAISKVSGDVKIIDMMLAKLDVGGNVIEGKIRVDISGSKPFITGNLASNLLNVMTLAPKKKTASLSVIKSANAAAYVPDEKLDLSFLKAFDANLNFDIKKLILNEDISLENLKGTADVKNGVLNIKPLSFIAGGGIVSGNLSAMVTSNALTLNLDGKGIVIQQFLKNLTPKNESTFGFKSGGETNLHIAIKSNGATYQSVIENLDGQVIVVIGQSQLQAGALKYLKGNFIAQLLSALKMEAKDPKMSMKCAVVRADIAKGKASFPKGIVFDSKKMIIVGDGDINLKNDKIDIAIKPFNGNLTDTNIAQAISSLVKISGTVQNPGIAIDTASVVKNVVGVAMSGPAFIGSQLLLDVDQAPCYTALKNTKFSNMFEAPTGARAGVQSVYRDTSDVVSEGLGIITDATDGIVQGGTDLAKGVFGLFKKDKNKEVQE